MSLTDRLARGVKATFAANVIDVAANSLLIFLLASVLLSPDEYGLLYLALSVFSVVGMFATLGLPSSIARYVTEFEETSPPQVKHVMRSGLLFLLGLSVAIGLAVTLAGPWIAEAMDEPRLAPLMALGLLYILVYALRKYLVSVFQGLNRVDWSAVVNSIQAAGRVIFAVSFILLGFGVVGALAGYIVGIFTSVVVGSVVLYWSFYRGYESAEREEGLVRRMLEYSVPLTVTKGATTLDKQVDTILVGLFLNATAVGWYTLAKQVAEVCVTPANSLGFTISPALGEQQAGDAAETAATLFEQAVEYVLLLYVPAAVGLVLVAEPMVLYVFGPGYLGAVAVIQVFSVYILAKSVTAITSDGLDFLGRARDRAIVKSIASVANFLLNLVLIPTVGVVGAAWATLFTYSFYTLANVYIVTLELPVSYGGIARSVAGVSVVSLVMGAGVYLLLPYVTGIVTLLGVVAVGMAIWLAGVAGSGLLDVRKAASYVT